MTHKQNFSLKFIVGNVRSIKTRVQPLDFFHQFSNHLLILIRLERRSEEVGMNTQLQHLWLLQPIHLYTHANIQTTNTHSLHTLGLSTTLRSFRKSSSKALYTFRTSCCEDKYLLGERFGGYGGYLAAIGLSSS